MTISLVPRVLPKGYQEIERISERKLESLFPGQLDKPVPVDAHETWELLGDQFDTHVSDELPEGIEGRTWPNRKVEISTKTYLGLLDGIPRARFTTIHECAHAWMHADQIKNVLESCGVLTLNRRSEIPAYEDPEWQANTFASTFLMPRPAIQTMMRIKKAKMLHKTDLMETFHVSAAAAEVRMNKLQRHI